MTRMTDNILRARADHTDRRSIQACHDKFVKFEGPVKDIINAAMPGASYRPKPNSGDHFDLINDLGTVIEVEAGTWSGDGGGQWVNMFPPPFSVNLLARKTYYDSDVFIKVDCNLRSAFMINCREVCRCVDSGEWNVEKVEQYKVSGTGDWVYKIRSIERERLVTAGLLAFCSHGDFSPISKFFFDNGFHHDLFLAIASGD